MGVLHRRTVFFSYIIAIFFVVFAASAVATRTSTHRKLGGVVTENGEGWMEEFEREMMSRRRLSGPGSSPPSCRSKCGRCTPCSPVHIPVHPGFTLPLEYYPEAWRCKCRNKLYMP